MSELYIHGLYCWLWSCERGLLLSSLQRKKLKLGEVQYLAQRGMAIEAGGALECRLLHTCGMGVSGEEGAAVGKGWKWVATREKEKTLYHQGFLCDRPHQPPSREWDASFWLLVSQGCTKTAQNSGGYWPWGLVKVCTWQISLVPGFLSP